MLIMQKGSQKNRTNNLLQLNIFFNTEETNKCFLHQKKKNVESFKYVCFFFLYMHFSDEFQ